MTEEKKRILQARMATLHDKYCKQLPNKYHEINDIWIQYQTDLSNPEHIELFYRLIHTLKGTAATFGFVKQADICFSIQQELLKIKEGQSVLCDRAVVNIQRHLATLKENINSPAEDISP